MIIDRLRNDLQKALRAKDELWVSTVRLLLAEIRNQWIAKQKDLTDEDVVAVIRRSIKQRQEAIEAYQKGNRPDLLQKEQKELDILSNYLPQQMAPEELKQTVKEVIEELGAAGPQDFGKVMGRVMGRVKERAEGKIVAETVKNLLADKIA